MSDGIAYEHIRRLYSSSVNCMRYSHLAANYGGDTEMSPLDNAMQVIENLRSINAQLTTERDELRAKIEGGVRVYAKNSGHIIYADQFTDRSNATLLIDDGVEI